MTFIAVQLRGVPASPRVFIKVAPALLGESRKVRNRIVEVDAVNLAGRMGEQQIQHQVRAHPVGSADLQYLYRPVRAEIDFPRFGLGEVPSRRLEAAVARGGLYYPGRRTVGRSGVQDRDAAWTGKEARRTTGSRVR